jgi:hypothetical protein
MRAICAVALESPAFGHSMPSNAARFNRTIKAHLSN